MLLNSLFTIIIDFSINFILHNSIIIDVINYILTTTIILILSGISFYMYKGIKRGLKILVPVSGVALAASQTYLNHLQIQEIHRSRSGGSGGNNNNNNKDDDKNKDNKGNNTDTKNSIPTKS